MRVMWILLVVFALSAWDLSKNNGRYTVPLITTVHHMLRSVGLV